MKKKIPSLPKWRYLFLIASGIILISVLYTMNRGNKHGFEQLQCKPLEEVDTLARMDEKILLDTISPAIVRIENGKLFGSGIIWKMSEEVIHIVTNQHLNEMSEEVKVIFWDGVESIGKVISSSREYDLSFIAVPIEDFGYDKVENYRYIYYNEEQTEKLQLGAEIFILGSADYPAGNLFFGNVANLSIYMEDFGTELMWVYCQVKPGMSGSGVFDKYGNLIGIVCGGNENSEAAVIPISIIQKEWDMQEELQASDGNQM